MCFPAKSIDRKLFNFVVHAKVYANFSFAPSQQHGWEIIMFWSGTSRKHSYASLTFQRFRPEKILVGLFLFLFFFFKGSFIRADAAFYFDDSPIPKCYSQPKLHCERNRAGSIYVYFAETRILGNSVVPL